MRGSEADYTRGWDGEIYKTRGPTQLPQRLRPDGRREQD